MAWYDKAFFYHIYPLGLCGAEPQNPYEGQAHRLGVLTEWLPHLQDLGVTALYLGPLFESGTHGYDTTDYRRVDRRLGTNDELRELVRLCHDSGIRVVLDAVFNHTGRDFFAFRDLRERRWDSPFRDWYCHVDFGGNTEYNDGFSYVNWGGYNLLAKLNLRNPEVRSYLLETVRFWVSEFDVDGLRLDAADVLDMDFMRELRQLANTVKPEFWLMGEVIHGDYRRWVNDATLHAVTDYALHKALYSGHNDHNYFEIAHTVNRFLQEGIDCRKLYSFADNHDVERIHSKLRDPRCWLPVHVLLFSLPGIPSIYYGSEFGLDGRKEHGSDAALRPCLSLPECLEPGKPWLEPIRALGRIYRKEPDLALGDYEQLLLTNRQYAFRRGQLLIAVNNDDAPAHLTLRAVGDYRGALHGEALTAENGTLTLRLGPCDGEILIPSRRETISYEPLHETIHAAVEEPACFDPAPAAAGIPYEQMTVEQLQAAILDKLAANGPVTDRMRREVAENVYRDSLLNWIKSFR